MAAPSTTSLDDVGAHDTILTLSSLNDDIKTRILEFLLLAREVEVIGPNETKSYTTCDFSVSILRANKDFHELGVKVFRSNHFILMSLPDVLSRVLHSQDARMWSKKLQKFKDYHLRLHIGSKNGGEGSKSQFFLLYKAHLDRVVVGLCLLIYAGITFPNARQLKLKLNIDLRPANPDTQQALPISTQRALLLPLTKLYGPGQSCKIVGLVEPALAKDVIAKVTSSVQWKRVQARHLLEVMLDQKILADERLKHGFMELANITYHGALRVAGLATPLVEVLKKSDDPTLAEAYSRIVFQLQLGSDLVHLWVGARCEDQEELEDNHFDILDNRHGLKVDREEAPTEWPHLAALSKQIFAVAHFCTDNCYQAMLHFQMANDLVPNTYKSDLDLIKLIMSKPTRPSEEVKRKATAKFFRNVPMFYDNEPVVLPISAVAAYDQEVYQLKKLGYTGDFLEGRVCQKEGWCVENNEEIPCRFDPAKIDKLIATQLRINAEADKKGNRRPDLVVDVSLRAPRAEESRNRTQTALDSIWGDVSAQAAATSGPQVIQVNEGEDIAAALARLGLSPDDIE